MSKITDKTIVVVYDRLGPVMVLHDGLKDVRFVNMADTDKPTTKIFPERPLEQIDTMTNAETGEAIPLRQALEEDW